MFCFRQSPIVTRHSPRGFTIVEILVVSFICLLLMSMGALIYSNCLKAYRESQGLTAVFETAKIINRDFHDYLSHVVPVRGCWISPKCVKFGTANTATTSTVDRYYLVSSGTPTKATVYDNTKKDYDYLFSKAQYPADQYSPGDPNAYYNALGYNRQTDPANPATWNAASGDYQGLRGWWLPAFFGQRDPAKGVDGKTVLEVDDVRAGSWGWPRPDYRLSVDADAGKFDSIACWFYAEDRRFNSPRTLALDNANVLLMSIKFTKKSVNGREETQLSFLRHHIVGFDTASQGFVKADQSFGDMLRQITIDPYYMDTNGDLQLMNDDALGCRLSDGANTAGSDSDPPTTGTQVPRCFNIQYTLRNPGSLKSHRFALRVYCLTNPQ